MAPSIVSRPVHLDRMLRLALGLTRRAAAMARNACPDGRRVAWKEDRTPVTALDRRLDAFFQRELADGSGWRVVSEETAADGAEAGAGPAWVVDPVDGTKHWLTGRATYSVHVALVERGRPVLGVVAFPARHEILYARRGGGAWVERSDDSRQRLPVDDAAPSVALSLVPVPAAAHRLAREHGIARVRDLGWTTGAALVDPARAGFGIAVGDAGRRVWDLAAPAAIVTEAGGRVTDWQGRPLRFTHLARRLPPWVASVGCDHERVVGGAHRLLRYAAFRFGSAT